MGKLYLFTLVWLLMYNAPRLTFVWIESGSFHIVDVTPAELRDCSSGRVGARRKLLVLVTVFTGTGSGRVKLVRGFLLVGDDGAT